MDVHQPQIPKEDIAKSLNIPVYSDKIIARHWAEILSHQVKKNLILSLIGAICEIALSFSNPITSSLDTVMDIFTPPYYIAYININIKYLTLSKTLRSKRKFSLC